MRIILLSIITLIIIITSIACAGRCGPSNYIPTGPDDCKSFGNSTHACCYLTMRDAPADYTICYWMDKTDVTPVISIGKLSYRVDCEGMDDFYKYFPLENKFYPCGVQNPLNPQDCWPYSTGSGACCMAGETPDMNGEGDPFCYFFPEAHFEKINFTVDTQVEGLKYYVSCHGSYVNTNIVYYSKIFLTLLFLSLIF